MPSFGEKLNMDTFSSTPSLLLSGVFTTSRLEQELPLPAETPWSTHVLGQGTGVFAGGRPGGCAGRGPTQAAKSLAALQLWEGMVQEAPKPSIGDVGHRGGGAGRKEQDLCGRKLSSKPIHFLPDVRRPSCKNLKFSKTTM